MYPKINECLQKEKATKKDFNKAPNYDDLAIPEKEKANKPSLVIY